MSLYKSANNPECTFSDGGSDNYIPVSQENCNYQTIINNLPPDDPLIIEFRDSVASGTIHLFDIRGTYSSYDDTNGIAGVAGDILGAITPTPFQDMFLNNQPQHLYHSYPACYATTTDEGPTFVINNPALYELPEGQSPGIGCKIGTCRNINGNIVAASTETLCLSDPTNVWSTATGDINTGRSCRTLCERVPSSGPPAPTGVTVGAPTPAGPPAPTGVTTGHCVGNTDSSTDITCNQP